MKIDKLIERTTIADFEFIRDYEGDDLNRELIKRFELEDFTISELNEYTNKLSEYLNEGKSLVLNFRHKGVNYGFIPKLTEMTAGEFIDLDDYCKYEDIPRIMSILYRPIVRKGFLWNKGKYKIEKYKETHNKFNDLPVSYYFGAMVFFWIIKNELLKISELYILQETIQMKKEELMVSLLSQFSRKNTDGIT